MTTDEEFFPVPERELRDAGVDAMLEPIREKLDELMKDVTPSAILSRAADLIRDRAGAATPGPWSTVRRFDRNGNLRQADFTRPPAADGCAPQTRAVRPHEVPDYEWIALMSPAVAPAIEAILREAARKAAVDETAARFVVTFEGRPMRGPGALDKHLLTLAEHVIAVLGEKEDSTDDQ